jgi:D-glycero-alpha-D-manno-heptose-7-phosphate kinase
MGTQREAVDVFAPARADLAGGTLDLWPLYCFHRPAITVNVALGCGVRVRVRRASVSAGQIIYGTPDGTRRVLARETAREHLAAQVVFHFIPEGGVAVEIREQVPVASGLGGSSVLAVALARACLGLTHRRMAPRRLVELLRDLEAEVLQAPTGVQDYYPALLGGALAIHLGPGGERVERLPVDRSWIAQRLAVVFSGIRHASGMVNWQVYRARVDGDHNVASRLAAIAAAAQACRAALVRRDERAVGRAVAQEWEARRSLAPEVSSREVDRLLAAGLEAGAVAAKACGAGGGGSVLFWSPAARREKVLHAVLAAASGEALALPTLAGSPRVRSS